jgi:murein DD-endopeptidase MepM/ murein hydrolase activator NlpD
VANENAGFDAGVPARPGEPVLSRRELREREARSSAFVPPEHDVEAELERQLAIIRARAMATPLAPLAPPVPESPPDVPPVSTQPATPTLASPPVAVPRVVAPEVSAGAEFGVGADTEVASRRSKKSDKAGASKGRVGGKADDTSSKKDKKTKAKKSEKGKGKRRSTAYDVAPGIHFSEPLTASPELDTVFDEALAPELPVKPGIPPLSPLTRATLADVAAARAQAGPEPDVPVGSTARAQRPKRRGPFIAVVAMGFVAAIALATSVPATALLSPEQMSLAAQQARAAAATGTDVGAAGQTVDGTGKVVAAGRDGVNVVGGRTQVSSLAGSNRTAGAYSTTKLKVTVPVSTTRLQWPFDSVTVSSPFGYRESIWGSSNYHTGLDIAPTAGTPIRAVGDGIVTEVTGLGGMIGVSVTIDHNLNGMKFSSVYGHMQYGSPTVKPGDTISAGTVIGNVGSTGFATGPHLHLEIRTDEDGPQDPYPFLVQYAGSPPNFTKTF